jgi:hypothetical protein
MRVPECCVNVIITNYNPLTCRGRFIYLTKIIFLLTEAFPLSSEK